TGVRTLRASTDDGRTGDAADGQRGGGVAARDDRGSVDRAEAGDPAHPAPRAQLDPAPRGDDVTTPTVDRQGPGYLDPASPLRERVEDLLARMTLEEKLAQLCSRWVFELAAGGGALVAAARDLLRHGIGQITRIAGASSLPPSEAAELANTVQRHLVEETRLGIPAIVHEEICSGVMARGATVFPQAIGLASTWEPNLV